MLLPCIRRKKKLVKGDGKKEMEVERNTAEASFSRFFKNINLCIK